MEIMNNKRELVSRLMASDFIDKGNIESDNPEWKKPPEKVKNTYLIQEAARSIAKKKLDIQALSDEK
jgi:hypothetical protein